MVIDDHHATSLNDQALGGNITTLTHIKASFMMLKK